MKTKIFDKEKKRTMKKRRGNKWEKITNEDLQKIYKIHLKRNTRKYQLKG